MSSATMDTEELARLALGGRALKNRRVRRAIIARLINENGESYEGDESEEGDEEEETTGGGGEDREMLRLLIGSKMLRRRRVRRALLAHLLRSKSEESEGDEGEEDTGEETGGEGRELVRALIASKILRRRKVRRAILIHLLKTKAESGEFEGSDDSESEGEEETGDEGGGEDREIVRALIASKMLRRRRVRRALLTHLLREKEEAVA